MVPEASVLRTPTGLYEVKLKGRFSHPHWVAFLFADLAEKQVSVVSGRAVQSQSQEWDTRLTLDFGRSASLPSMLDYVLLAQRKPAIDMTIPRLSKFEIVRRRDEALEVRLEGPDQIGFLGRFLGRVSLLTLFPCDIEIATMANIMRDRIAFNGIGGQRPADEVQQLLQTMLNGMTVSK
jgi:hypothetical protein